MWSATLLLFIIGFLHLATAHPTANSIDPAPPSTLETTTHNIYLSTCVPRGRKNDDDAPTKQNFTAIAYFRQPLNATTLDPDTKAPKPDRSALVAQPPEPWEGVKWRVKVWRDKMFAAAIDAGAGALAKGSLAGSVKLDDEEYVCFKDGVTEVRVRDDGVRGDCVADYWCAGVDAGRGKGEVEVK